jgi:hypothetical protein
MSALGQTATCPPKWVMSALPPDTGSDGAYRPPGFLFRIDQLGDMAHRVLLRHLALLFEKCGGLLDAFPVDAALAFVGCGFCRDGAGDAGINRLDAPKVMLSCVSVSGTV